MIKKILFFVFTLISISNAKASLKDSINYYIKNTKPVLIGGMSSRNTFIGSYKTSVTGLAVGYDFGGKLRFYAGAYWLSKPITDVKTINGSTPQEYKVNESSSFWYVGFTGDYTFLKKGKWSLDVPVRIGLGSSTIEQNEVSGQELLLNKETNMIVPVESGVNGFYKLGWWIGLGGGIGTRIVLGQNASKRYSGTYYTLGVTIFFEDIYNHIRKDMKENSVSNIN